MIGYYAEGFGGGFGSWGGFGGVRVTGKQCGWKIGGGTARRWERDGGSANELCTEGSWDRRPGTYLP